MSMTCRGPRVRRINVGSTVAPVRRPNSTGPAGAVHNLCGTIGAYVADLVMFCFGYGSYLLVLWAAMATFRRFRPVPLGIGFLAAHLRQVFGERLEVRLFRTPSALLAALEARSQFQGQGSAFFRLQACHQGVRLWGEVG